MVRISLILAIATLLIVVAASGSTLAQQADNQITLVRDGKPSATIVTAPKPTKSTQLAVAELQYHVEKITGTTLPVASDEAPVNGVRVLVGESKATRASGLKNNDFKPQEYLIRCQPGLIVLMVWGIRELLLAGKKNSAKTVGLLMAAFIAGFAAWFIQPDRVLERYANRITDAKNAFTKHMLDTLSATDKEKERSYKTYIAAGYAVELEKKAVELRRKNGVRSFNSAFVIKILWCYSAFFMLWGGWVFYGGKEADWGTETAEMEAADLEAGELQG